MKLYRDLAEKWKIKKMRGLEIGIWFKWKNSEFIPSTFLKILRNNHFLKFFFKSQILKKNHMNSHMHVISITYQAKANKDIKFLLKRWTPIIFVWCKFFMWHCIRLGIVCFQIFHLDTSKHQVIICNGPCVIPNNFESTNLTNFHMEVVNLK